ncbi:MAG: SLC13 family permease [Magnetospirillum sp. WYHS-4]
MAVLIFVAVFVVLYRGAVDRRAAMLAGAAAMVVVGGAWNFYSVEQAIGSIYFETLALIFGMSAATDLLSRSGFFARVAGRVVAHADGNRWLALVLLSLVTYVISLFANNLSAMLIMLPMTLALCRDMGLRPAPVLAAEIVASNLGGASTMVGDFPNMIIASAARLSFLDFIGGMMVPCLMLLAAMLWYFGTQRKGVRLAVGQAKESFQAGVPARSDQRGTRLGLSIMVGMLIGFLSADLLGVRPAWVAIVGGVAAVVASHGGKEADDWFAACGGEDILYFAGLFVMVGGLAAAGVLDGLGWVIAQAGGGNALAGMVVLMWMAAGVTLFLSAGPATAFFIPLAEQMYVDVSDVTVWWALSLGVLAGSSGTLTGATAGSLVETHLERFFVRHPSVTGGANHGLDFKGYLRWGMPIMGIFLALSTLYVIASAG